MTTTDTIQHTTWCSREAHARLEADMPGHGYCVGRDIYVQIAGRDLGGYWQHALDEGEPAFDFEWDMKFANLDIGTLRSLYKLFVAMSWQDVERIGTALGQAIDEYEGNDAWRDSV